MPRPRSGATPFSIYQTYPAEEIAYLCRDAAAKVAIVEQAFLPLVLAARDGLPGLQHVIVVDGEAPEGTIALAAVEAAGQGFDAEAAAAQVKPQDVLTLIYTSGTTGPPKGVQLSHDNVMVAARGTAEIINIEPGSRLISWLPAAHIAERMAHHYIPIVFAGTVTTCPNPREIISFLPQVRPTWFFAVPRIWEKLKAGLEAMLAAQPEEQRAPAEAALAAARERVSPAPARRGRPRGARGAGAPGRREHVLPPACRPRLRPGGRRQRRRRADPRRGDRVLPRHRDRARRAVGDVGDLRLRRLQPARGGQDRHGRDRRLPGVELAIADDGEVLCRGDFVMLGYRNQPEKTAETIDGEGWLHTGDIGEIDADGYLKIVDRKKEIIINAAGKNMSPANIEAAIKSGSPLIGQAICIGDARPYNTALIVLDADFAPQWAARHGLEGKSLEELAAEPAMIEAVHAGVEAGNAAPRSGRAGQEVQDHPGRLAAGRR